MNVSARRFASAVVLQVAGRLDQDTCDAFRGELMTHIESAVTSGGGIVLDLSKMEYVSSAGLRCFMLASRQAKTHHARIFVAELQPMVKEIFEISHFNLVFQVFPKVREALAAVSADAVSAYEKG
jgi:anti-sigma B factor antagonist